MEPRAARVLTINSGSSSLKLALYVVERQPRRLLSAEATSIGRASSTLSLRDASGSSKIETTPSFANHAQALTAIFALFTERDLLGTVSAVGHRLVHGGAKYRQPTKLNAPILADLQQLVPLAPDHLPQAMALIEAIDRRLPNVAQVACFDTEFHRTLPPRARTLPLPRELTDDGIIRFGFHGLSYEYLSERLREVDPDQSGGRAVLAHLGNGASLAAVWRGTSIDTSMGFTPAGGLIMSSRSGDLDPGILVYLLSAKGYSADEIDRLVNRSAGLVGISGLSSNMQELLAARKQNPLAALAIEMFCYQARKFIAAYAAALEGLDTLVFAGGIGEHSADIRSEICTGLSFLGVHLDESQNVAAAEVISAPASKVVVRVIPTDEDLMIARNTIQLLSL
jgi:acetate kinase